MDRPTCKTCRFFFRHYRSNPRDGDCRRMPPQIPGAEAGSLGGYWPQITDDKWCGEHKEKDE